jgi:DNA-binding NarL/FixJ family response regulator
MTSFPPPITLLSVDDHPLFRQGIASVLSNEPMLRLVAEAADGAEAVDSYRRWRPDVTLMDIQMPGMNGIDAITAIRAEFPAARIVVLTTYEGDMHALRAIRAGAVGYLLKSMVRKELFATVRAVHAGQRSIPGTITRVLMAQRDEDVLSERELQVLKLAAQGNTNRLIGTALGIAEDTVKGHMKNVLAKLQANDRTHAVLLAIERGLIDVPVAGRASSSKCILPTIFCTKRGISR